ESALAAQYAGTDGILIGTMDLLFREDDGWVLVDYKTDYARSGAELLNEYSLQLILYQKAAELLLNAPVKQAFVYSFTLDEAFEVNLNDIAY
ncbi:MAG: PD-(D/E)XK nuclease family protein, partial [Oscillospiraceae bacterium]|nr:PD-(D/E)XK nuclease family protein [Oscillospiraceae bacterium]